MELAIKWGVKQKLSPKTATSVLYLATKVCWTPILLPPFLPQVMLLVLRNMQCPWKPPQPTKSRPFPAVEGAETSCFFANLRPIGLSRGAPPGGPKQHAAP
eukprot:TRINITY_DN67077_c0_g1_i1.p2 TRINITY_DN67077_c0_g1~~TRINITY_DN67077_c0_g1_i1.p2  ORF type:complete len:101 (+),score=0.12 TRINITY_DN67077_c0_g1_i1:460-762(+)